MAMSLDILPPDKRREVDAIIAARHGKSPAKSASRPRHSLGHMNHTEERFSDYLITREIFKKSLGWRFEAIKLRLAKATWYTPDFSEIQPDNSVIFYEVKVRWEDDARAKFKIAAETFREYRFIAATWKNGEFALEEIHP